ncbi:protein AF1q [Tachyglossus aculeatus]|uniref:protein AF1q n=1 Tax=Tachyglossus aculeatus TaxID=9261 RepID=UPI0018F56340|nr:protein AF1q [Tachyglossus aculeatus]
MLDSVSSQYSSFLFWRAPIPELDVSELQGLGLSDLTVYEVRGGGGKLGGAGREDPSEDDALLPFNAFNFWRVPIADVHAFELDLI